MHRGAAPALAFDRAFAAQRLDALLHAEPAEAERLRSPGAPRVAAQDNLMLTSCIEDKLGRLTRFTDRVSYAGLFFPDRIDRCGEAVRLRDQEKVLPAYEFLRYAEPKLYDFARYNLCLMKNEATSPAAR